VTNVDVVCCRDVATGKKHAAAKVDGKRTEGEVLPDANKHKVVALVDAFRKVVTWNDSGNHKRYGQRHPKTGRIHYAFGIELTPLAALRSELEARVQEKELLDVAWMETKRQISWYRAQIRGLLAEWSLRGDAGVTEYDRRYSEIAVPIRTHLDLPYLRHLLEQHRSLQGAIADAMGLGNPASTKTPRDEVLEVPIARKESPKGEIPDAHLDTTNQESSVETDTGTLTGKGLQGSRAGTSEIPCVAAGAGVEHVRLSTALLAASEQFRDHLPADPNWTDIHEAAYQVRRDLRISQASWGEACQLLGRTGAALCVIIVDRATRRDVNHVQQPAGYFRGMLNRARGGELHLHRSIFGLVTSPAKVLT
jgi:replication initiation protein RepC